MRWVITLIVVIIVTVVVWFLREPLMGLFASSVPEPVPENQVEEPTSRTYASSTLGYSFEYPSTYTLNESFSYPFSETRSIAGVAVSVGGVAGTNLSQDTRVSVEQLPRASTCTGDIFIVDDVVASDLNDGGKEYSVATTSGAGAGNVYEEVVYALVGSTPCTAVRYAIHSSSLGNYEPGAVTEFDRGKLMGEFDAIRRSLRIFESSTATTTEQ